jgi:hypothetical protein
MFESHVVCRIAIDPVSSAYFSDSNYAWPADFDGRQRSPSTQRHLRKRGRHTRQRPLAILDGSDHEYKLGNSCRRS